MLEFIINLIWLIVNYGGGLIGALIIVYCLVRLSAIAWHKTKKEYGSRPYNYEEYLRRNHRNDEEK